MSDQQKITIEVDGQSLEARPGQMLIEVTDAAGIPIPRFCYHKNLSIAANCRMCLVEVEKAPKPLPACATPVMDGMKVYTRSPLARAAQKGTMEFLLINHPLDCPICDQGGECDLQDQAVAYGAGESRFHEHKRAVEDKDFGPLIRGVMTRCIHCTRCVRFASEIAGTSELGGVFRGEHLEIGTYVGNTITSELSGNMIDLCPVGALTNLPYAYKARPWELKKTESVDVLDAVGANIRVDARGGEVLRIVPRLHEDVNEEWLGDKSRFACDGLNRQRLDKPYVKKGGKLQAATWDEAFATIKAKVGDRACLKGNVDLFYVLKEGTPEEVDEAVRGTIEAAAPGGHFILATSDAIRDGTPVENVHAFCDAGRKYGSYDHLGSASE